MSGGRASYVCGFLFWESMVLLVQKTRPDWQRGLWNGIGGKIENSESALQAMTREFAEETTVALSKSCWQHFCTETGSDYCVYFFRAQAASCHAYPEANDVGEPLAWMGTNIARPVGNLRWLLPLAQDWRRMSPVEVHAIDNITECPTW